MSDPLNSLITGIPNLSEEDMREIPSESTQMGKEQAPSKEPGSSEQNNESSTEDTQQPKQERRKATDEEIIQKLKTPGKTLGEGFQHWAGQEPGWGNPAAYPAAAGAGLIDFGTGLLNRVIPGEKYDIPELPQYQHEGLQAVRDLSSLIIPTIYLQRFGLGKAQAAHKSVGWKLGNDKFVQWLGRAGIGVGAGVIVDELAPVQERDHSASGWLQKSWPKTWGWIPERFVTLDSDSPEVKRQKNRNEGAAFGFLADLIVPVARLIKGQRGIQHATSWVPKNEKATNWLAKKNKKFNLSDDPVENDLLNSAKNRDDQLTELGKSTLEDTQDISKPILGVHDFFEYGQQGVRSSDEGGIVAAAVDQVRIVKNIDTRYGRVGSILSPKNLREMLTGKQKPWTVFNDLGKALKETKVDYNGSNGRVIKHSESLREAEKLGAALYETDLEGMKNILRPLSKLDPQTGARVLSREAYRGVMDAIQKYTKEFINEDLARAQGLTGTSIAGQISDMAETSRLMDGTQSSLRSVDQILDRVEFLMNLKGQTTHARNAAAGLTDVLNRLTKKGSNLSYGKALDAIGSEKNQTLEAIDRIARESKKTIDTLRNVKAERPQLLGPLMLAYEVTDGKVASISALNNYIRNSTGVVKKAFFDARADMPSAWTQGMWANIYNSVLSAVGTPLKAALSNTVLMVERPLATFAGAIATGDAATLRRAHYMYNVGIADTLQRSWSHMNQVFSRASKDPGSVGYIMRDDIARKNEQQMDLLKSFADASDQEGNFGPSMIVNQIEAMNDLAEHPVLRFSANAMTAFDGFTRSFVGNIEARARAYDALMNTGGKIDEKRIRAMGRRVYSEMFDETGMITDKAVEYASREVAMNLDNPLVDSMNELVRRVPAIKPFVMFPKTSINMMKMAGSHNPLGLFVDQVNAFQLPFHQMDEFEVDKLLTERGIPLSGNKQAAYDTIRAELKGRKAIGTLSVIGAGALFTQDRITGNGIYDKTRQRTRRELGWKPKSFKGLDGKWYSYENLGPITDWLALTSDIMDNFVDGTLDEPTTEVLLQKTGFLLSANLTDKTFMAGLEPLGDVLSGNAAAANRWAGTFGSGLLPGGGFRNEFARLLTPQLKEVEQEVSQILANRNPGLKEQLPDLYDWMDGSKVGEPLGFFARVWNVYSPLWKVSEAISPEKQFLIDIEFDGRPTLRTNGQGVEYSPAQRSEITRLMGEEGWFAEEVKRIMNTPDGKAFRKQWKELANKGVYMDRKLMNNIQYELSAALRQAKQFAESQIADAEAIEEQQWINDEIEDATRLGDVERVLELQQ
tara:strand:+ start:2981 stop:6904 length:3924 start_codon:yes stop_codon:yes gene_type:complete